MKSFFFLIAPLFVSAAALAVDPNAPPPPMLNTITEMRVKQEQEENNVMRMIQQPIRITNEGCSLSELSRQRMRDLDASTGEAIGTVTVEAGHQDVTIDNNQGEINNSVNVQVVNPDDRKCF